MHAEDKAKLQPKRVADILACLSSAIPDIKKSHDHFKDKADLVISL